jgi:hypothetical protein
MSDPGADHWAIAAVKARYFRYMDSKRWDDVRAQFTDDATFEHPTIGRFDDVDVAVAAVAEHIGGMFTVHLGGLPEITLTGPDTADGIFPMGSHSLPAGAGHLLRTFGHYHDAFRRDDGVWRLTALRLVSTYREP